MRPARSTGETCAFRTRAGACLLFLLLAPVGSTGTPPAGPMPVEGPLVSGELSRAQRLIESGAFVEAVSLLRDAVRRHPGDADVRLLLGSALALVPRRSEALEELAAAIRLRPDFAPGYHALGMALARFVEPDRAREAFEKAIELDPRLARAHVDLALVLAQSGQTEAAARHLDTAIRIEGDSPKAAYAHYLRGLLHGEQDQPEKAVASFERAVALRPDDADALLHLGLARRRRLDFEGCLAALRQAVRVSPDNARAQYELGRELLRAGLAGQAVRHLRIAVASKPDDKAALYSLARALFSAGEPREAEQAAARLGDLRARAQHADQQAFEASRLNNEAIELEKAGKLQGAIEGYASALEVDPLNTVFRRNLGLALCRAGRWREGVAELRDVVRLDPNDADAARALYVALEMAESRP